MAIISKFFPNTSFVVELGTTTNIAMYLENELQIVWFAIIDQNILFNFSTNILGQPHQKSDNLQYNMLGSLVDGTNDSTTKRLMFQALFFS